MIGDKQGKVRIGLAPAASASAFSSKVVARIALKAETKTDSEAW